MEDAAWFAAALSSPVPNAKYSSSKRGIVNLPFCQNCNGQVVEDQRFRIPPNYPEYGSGNGWCSSGCYLAYAKDFLLPAEFVRLKTDLGIELHAQLKEKPDRLHLQHNGGTMTLVQYHTTTLPEYSYPDTGKRSHYE